MPTPNAYDGTESEGRYVANETYDGALFIQDREIEAAWIRSDVVRALEP